jgi:hypothetical protein
MACPTSKAWVLGLAPTKNPGCLEIMRSILVARSMDNERSSNDNMDDNGIIALNAFVHACAETLPKTTPTGSKCSMLAHVDTRAHNHAVKSAGTAQNIKYNARTQTHSWSSLSHRFNTPNPDSIDECSTAGSRPSYLAIALRRFSNPWLPLQPHFV